MIRIKNGLLTLLVFQLIACNNKFETPLPILGNLEITNTGDTIFHKIPDFKLIDQDSNLVSNNTLSPYLYISDFFFMSCPTICPKVKKQMLRLYDEFENEPKIKFVSHTIDPTRDTPKRLKEYATNLGVDTDKWLFLNGPKDIIFELADNYFVAAFEDKDAPGGFNHSGKIILVDTRGHVRAFTEGTISEDVDDFMIDINRLLKEYKN